MRCTVVCRHRGSHRYVWMDVAAKYLVNWRVELVYSPHVIRIVRERGELRQVYNPVTKGRFGPDTDQARVAAEGVVAEYVSRGAVMQPYVSRPPAAGYLFAIVDRPAFRLSHPLNCPRSQGSRRQG